MFFSPELLAKRDSGFGLLWLAATLGSRSAFRKLPKRSVLTADISQLCDLISQPVEPLALRLSSNLMFGVVRVYKVKQEIFLTDVTNCVSSLKKVVQDLRTIAAQEGQLQMANPIARPSAVTIVPNPQIVCALDYDALVVDWDEYLNIGDTTVASISTIDADDDDFNPNQKKKKRPKTVSKDAAEPEVVRKESHTLEEHHEHIFSASYDLSLNGSSRDTGADPADGGPGFDNFFSDGLEDGAYGMELGEDLARELGWTISPVKSVRGSDRHPDLNFDGINQMPHVDLDFNFNADDIQMDVDPAPIVVGEMLGNPPCPDPASKKKRIIKAGTPSSRAGSLNPRRALSSATSFSRQLLSQDNETSQPLRDIMTEECNRENQAVPPKKLKRTRLLLDARTELTDEELKVAREKYVQLQRLQKWELLQKKIEKESGRIIEDMIWGAPKGMHARELIHFWQESFKVQVETRSGALRLHEVGYESPVRQQKRRKINRKIDAKDAIGHFVTEEIQPDADNNVDYDMNWDYGNNQDVMNVDNAGPLRYSSEEPGQARRMSKSGSVISANLDLNLEDFDKVGGSAGSQWSSLFPWDNAGPSSSGGGNDIGPDIEVHSIGPVDVNLRTESINSRRASSLIPSQRGSIVGGLAFSPVIGNEGSQEDFAFDVDRPVLEDSQQEIQKPDINLATLEKNSYNFLEYAKMQQRSLPRPDDRLSFDNVVPKNTSTRHVAAAAFYHCLVLATKNLIRLEQLAPYEPFLIVIK